ncbi:TetR/AcrR family transcriptional regulator [Frankia sp. AgKG'84/4]|uniref:TetR/AcrR family transcriptional regulator n=1 Tax=Frankia sp. AgKG'84/4 TaxID=573490 RepID=UPI00200BE9CE|nr:TetR family transcriptional regulator [Frankia sp. AgKG'84/4]MCL9793814.1 TetR/AcrR family transcriptional regulator [Frankia sp. AgKG'84/4]
MADTRSRMVDAAIRGLQRHGAAGMSFTDVLQDSGAARGAIYHHFPGGKTQLVAEAAARNGEEVRAALATLPAGDPRTVVTAFLDAIRPVLAASTAGGGCAVAAITVGAGEPGSGETDLRRAAAGIFASWGQILAERLESPDLAPTEAGELATTLIMLLEGAHVLCRAAGDLEPFEQAARTAVALTRARLA